VPIRLLRRERSAALSRPRLEPRRRYAGLRPLALSMLGSRAMDFTTAYLDYEALTAQLRAWAKEHPSLVRLESIARTEEGRDLHLLIIGPDPDRARPTVWVDGNMHAGELCGSNVALQIAHDMLRIHLGESGKGLHQLPPHVLETLRELRFYIVPRMSP